MSDSDNLGAFFGKIHRAGTGARLFSWKKICDVAIVAEEECKVLIENLSQAQQKLAEMEGLAALREAEIGDLNSHLVEMKSLNENLHDDVGNLSDELKILRNKLDEMTRIASANANSAKQWETEEGARQAELTILNDQYKELSTAHATLSNEHDALIADLSAERTAHLADNDQARTFREQYLYREKEIDDLRKELNATTRKLTVQQDEIDGYVKERDAKYAALAVEAERLNTLSTKFEEEKKVAEIATRQNMMEIFARHQIHVGEILAKICEELHLDLKTETTYRGISHPNFAVLVNNSYVFFNTVSPASPDKIADITRHVTEKATELLEAAKEDGVRGEAYLVVPSEIAADLTKFVFESVRCTVFVVTPEALQAIVSTLKRIEDYEFSRQITPFELDQICRFIGELSHMTKRKIALDTYFSNEMLEILQRTENLPTDVAINIIGYENVTRMNPPVERDAAVLTVPSLSAKIQKLEKAILARAAAESENVILEES
ncbi:MAG: hypothetical protein LBH02_00790 [Methanocalculaceae archaeon]|jgi:hypothetical protein|nr:hypothetical protein [Methanocalculaceae archaeon]